MKWSSFFLYRYPKSVKRNEVAGISGISQTGMPQSIKEDIVFAMGEEEDHRREYESKSQKYFVACRYFIFFKFLSL